MITVAGGHVHFRGKPGHVVAEIGVAITALLADAPADCRHLIKQMMDRCFERAKTDEAVEAFLDGSVAFSKNAIEDMDQYTEYLLLCEIQDRLKSMTDDEIQDRFKDMTDSEMQALLEGLKKRQEENE